VRIVSEQSLLPLANTDLRTDEPGRSWWAGMQKLEEKAEVVSARSIWIDPRTGAGFTASGHRVPDLVHWQQRMHMPGRREWLRGIGTAQHVRAAVSLRDSAMETNWYHFLVDLLGGRLRLVDSAIGTGQPVIIGPNLPPQMMDALRLGAMREREWVVQPRDRWMRVGRLTFARAPRHDPAAIDYLWGQLAVPKSDPSAKDRLLVAREPGTGRAWSNHAEVMDVARRFGLRLIHPATTSLGEQMERFGNASLVVGGHGAGLTGIVWRREAPLSVVDVQMRGRALPMRNFAALCAAMGARYVAVGEDLWRGPSERPWGTTQPTWKQDPIHVNPLALARAIESCLDGSSVEPL